MLLERASITLLKTNLIDKYPSILKHAIREDLYLNLIPLLSITFFLLTILLSLTLLYNYYNRDNYTLATSYFIYFTL